MKNRKSELREIVLDILLYKEKVMFSPSQFGHLTAGVAEVLFRRDNPNSDAFRGIAFPPERELEENDWLLVQEIFWDLVSERIINVGMDSANAQYPWFRLHSEAEEKLGIAQ